MQQERSSASALAAARATYRTWWHETVVPALLGDEEQVEQLAASKGSSRWTCTQGCVRGVRPYLVVLVFVIMALWLPLDIWRLDGIVPGTKDTYMVEAKLVEENKQEVWECYTFLKAAKSQECIYSCPCNIDTSGQNMGNQFNSYDPYAQVQMTGGMVQLSTRRRGPL
jgi:hypothetical protein